AHRLRVFAGQGVEGAVAQDDGAVLAPGFEAVPLQDADHLLPRAVGADAGAQRTRLAVQDVTHRFTGRAGLLHGAGQEPAGEFVAPAGQADGYLARGPPVELGRAARAGSGAPAAP